MKSETVFFGTYTRRISEGLYQAKLIDGQLIDARLVSVLGSPTYTKVAKDDVIYTVDKIDDEGGIAVVNSKTGDIKQIVVTPGASPAYLGMDVQRGFLFSGNYHRGTVEVFRIDQDGKLSLVDKFQNTGNGPLPEQTSSHIHFANLTPDQRLVVVDLGTDEVLVFDLSANGQLTNKTVFKTEAGFGPRHIRFSPDGQTAYLLGELSSKLLILDYKAGKFQLKQTLATIPDDWTMHNGAAAIRVSQDGNFVYVSNRGHNSVAVFDVAGEMAKLIQIISTEGDFPRDMALNADDGYLIVANQKTDNVSVFKRDARTGKLKLQQKDFMIPEGVRVEFSPK
ncbi:lactonase family protein [Weissella coleopterorum]|uniref:Lactonase family protein n=1 Tax=Weissella coleopterorum TaxID=2714949 RepID=A0A6G8B150_9LACO|nr:lactonase family protein [Weissella coleopterorum]QIL50976.1 lactonase family protein [Weissella coleopterorum]